MKGSTLAKAALLSTREEISNATWRVKAVFDEIKHTPTGEFNPEKILAKMDAIIQIKQFHVEVFLLNLKRLKGIPLLICI